MWPCTFGTPVRREILQSSLDQQMPDGFIGMNTPYMDLPFGRNT